MRFYQYTPPHQFLNEDNKVFFVPNREGSVLKFYMFKPKIFEQPDIFVETISDINFSTCLGARPM